MPTTTRLIPPFFHGVAAIKTVQQRGITSAISNQPTAPHPLATKVVLAQDEL